MKSRLAHTRVVLAAFLLLVILLPISSPLVKAETTTITIGKIVADDGSLFTGEAVAQIAIGDINNYMTANGMAYQFAYEMKSASGDAVTCLSKVQELNSEGIKFINGGGWSSQADYCLPYINENNILMLSSSSTSPSLKIANDNLFRLCPSDDNVGPALASMVWSYGYKQVIIIWRGDNWGDGLVNYFTPAYNALGGKVVGDSSTRYDPAATNFSSYLGAAEKQMKALKSKSSETGILLLSFNEASVMLATLKNYPLIYGTKWFGADGTALSWNLKNDVPEQSSHVKLFSTLANFNQGPLFWDAYNRYVQMTGQEFTAYTSFDYDIYWVLALSIVQANYVPGGDPLTVKAVLPEVAAGFNGASGYCNLNEYGDRPSQGYNIYGYGIYNYNGVDLYCGWIDTANNVYWDPATYRLYGIASGTVGKYQGASSASIVKGNWDLSIDSWNCHFTLSYSEKNLVSAIEESPKGSIDNFYVEGWGNIIEQTKDSVKIDCWLNFRKDWAKLDGTRETVWFGYPATITISRGSIYIDLPQIRLQNFDINGKTSTFSFN